jgi:LmbE family N-acetylglucosaminyl deacetylase
MRSIGVDDVRFLGLPDGGVADRVDGDVVATIGGLLREIRPDVTVTFGPDGITGHDDHVACWRLVTRAWLDSEVGELWYAAPPRAWLDEWRHVHDRLGVWMTGEPDGVDPEHAALTLELDGPDLDRKRAVLREHRSQTEAIASVLGEEGYRRWIRWEMFRRPSAGDLVAASAARVLAEAS